jgi:L-threonylcarbamoyladenylate synthase
MFIDQRVFARTALGEKRQVASRREFCLERCGAISISRLRRSVVIIPYAIDCLQKVARAIQSGGVIAFRTDTFYGLGADPFARAAVQRIKELKGREDNKPILIVISDRDQVERFITQPSQSFQLLSEAFWPGALTLIGKARPEVAAEITAGTGTIGVRLPNDERVRALVRACGGALTATSANPSHEPPATNANAVQNYFGDSIDLIIDDGESQTDAPSTVVDATSDNPKLIREGVIRWGRIQNRER